MLHAPELLLDLLHREGVQLRRQLGRDGEVARLGALDLVQEPACEEEDAARVEGSRL